MVITNTYSEIENERLTNVCNEHHLYHERNHKLFGNTFDAIWKIKNGHNHSSGLELIGYYSLGDIVSNKVKVRNRTKELALIAAEQILPILMEYGEESKQDLIRLQNEKEALNMLK